MSDQTKSTSRSIFLDTQAAEQSIVRLQSGADKLRDKITAGEAAGKSMNKELAKLDQVNTQIKSVQDQLDKGLKPTLIQQQNLVRQLNNELARMSENDPKFAAKLDNYKKQNAELGIMRDKINAVSTAQKESTNIFGEFAAEGLRSIAALLAFEKIKEIFTESVAESDKYQQSIVKLGNALQNAGRNDLIGVFEEDAQKLGEIYKRLNPADIIDIETKLVDYGKLTKAQIQSLLPVIIDYAAKQGITLQDASDVFTKALEGQAKGLKTYGINVKDGSTVTERFGIIIDQLAPKLRGSELALEGTRKGGWQSFLQWMNEAGIVIGDFFTGNDKIKDQQVSLAISAKQEADGAQILVDRYEELSNKTNKTAEEKKELEKITATLVGTFGTSVVEIDKETGSLKLNVEATKDLITQRLLLANQKAVELAGKYKKVLEDQKEATENLTKSQTAYNEKVKETGKTADQVNEKQNNYDRQFRQRGGPGATLSSAPTKDEQQVLSLSKSVNAYSKEAEKAKEESAELIAALGELGFKADDVNKLINPNLDKKVIGNGNPDDDKKAAEEAAKKAQEARKKLLELEREMTIDLAKSTLPELDAAYVKIQETLQKRLREIYANSIGGTKDEIQKDVQLAVQTAQDEIIKEFSKLHKKKTAQIEVEFKVEQDPKKFEDDMEKAIGKSLDEIAKKPSIADKVFAIFNRDNKAKADLALLKSAAGSKARLQAQLDELNEQEKQAIAASDHTEIQIAKIEEDYRQRKAKTIIAFYVAKVEQIASYAEQFFGILQTLNQAQTNSENYSLNEQIKNNDKRRKDIEKLAKSKVLSEIEAKRQIADLDASDDDRKKALEIKQFERNKELQLVQAGIQGAQNVLKTIGQFGPPLPPNFIGIAAMAFTVGSTIAELLAISKTKPSFGFGGRLRGPAHSSNNGMPVTNPNTGEIQAWLEGDELITNKKTARDKGRYTVSGTPSQIISSLNRMHGGVSWDSSATILPFWKSRKYRGLDQSGFTESRKTIQMFESGGVFRPQTEAANNPANTFVSESDDETNQLLRTLLFYLQNPVAPDVNISLTQLDDAYKQRDRIITEASG